jgi:hypothetical protein
MFDHPTRSKHLYASGGFHFWFDDVGMNQRIAAPTKKIAATMCPSPVLASLGGQNQLPTPVRCSYSFESGRSHSQSRFSLFNSEYVLVKIQVVPVVNPLLACAGVVHLCMARLHCASSAGKSGNLIPAP